MHDPELDLKKALVLTAYNRPHYLKETLETWREVRGFYDWPLHVFLEPSPYDRENVELLTALDHPDIHINVNPERYGVLHNPWVAFERTFMLEGFEFVVRAEDDLIVSTDILEYFSWAAESYRGDPQVAAVCAFTHENGDPTEVRKTTSFSPWVWGTWRPWWKRLIGPTWDHDYSTYNAVPGNQSGWDWNLNTRVFPERELKVLTPSASRVQNIGVLGTHAVPEQFETTESFVQYREKKIFFTSSR